MSSTVIDTASALKQACVDKLFQFEGTTEAAVHRNHKPKGRNMTGMGAQIRAYKRRIKATKRLLGRQYDDVQLMDLADVIMLERSAPEE